MKKNVLALTVLSIFLSNCSLKKDVNQKELISEQIIKEVIDSLSKQSNLNKFLIEKGVRQTTELWDSTDGNSEDFKQFCYKYFAKDEESKKQLFEIISNNFEVIYGYFNKITIELLKPLHLNLRDIQPIDEIFGSYNVYSHLNDDFFANKIAFIVKLNFPAFTLEEKNNLGKNWSRLDWAYARLGDVFISRVPSVLLQKYNDVVTKAETYISEYNIYMGNVQSQSKEYLFPKELKLITHWGLRDELKANYADKEKGFEKQKTIYEIMKRIITQEIPDVVINNNKYKWNPFENKVYDNGKEINSNPEQNKRYEHLLNIFHAVKQMDKYYPQYPTYIQRKFDLEMEISKQEIEELFTKFISSPEIKEIGNLISKRLGRPLEPFDIWYDGFKPRSTISEDVLSEKTKKLFKDAESFENYLPTILIKLGFNKQDATYITSKIKVDASRGAGHAWGSEMKGDFARLRTRISPNGMDYKGFNIAMHEFGHNVEQTLSLYNVDYYMLKGVPNTAFTEALAFIFQKRDLNILDIKNTDPKNEYLAVLDNVWSAYEIMGVSLVDIKVWEWMYQHPEATAEELKQQVIKIAKEIWNKYYSPVFGKSDEPILAIYSHMIDAPLYLSAYPLGHIIEFQLEQHLKEKNNAFAEEIKRIFSLGRLTPNKWMNEAVGHYISTSSMLESAKEALKNIK
jgi:hypothetical protein